MELSFTQTEALDLLEDTHTKEVLFGGGAGGGKSALGCYWAMKMALKYPGSRGMLGRATLTTLKETTLKTFWEVADMQGVRAAFKLYDKKVILGPNGSEILLKDLYAYPADPDFDELGSLELTYLFIDEANQVSVKGKNVAKSRIRYKIDEFKLKVPKALYTCNPAKNWVKTEFRDQHIKGTLPNHKAFVESLLPDNPHVFAGYADSLRELDRASRERLLMGNWDYAADPSSLLTQDEIQSIFTNSNAPSGQLYITADIARMGVDKTVIRVWSGWRVIERVILTSSRTTETTAQIQRLALKHGIPMHHVICDEGGVGGGVVDQLRCKGFVSNAVPFDIMNNKNFGMLKDQCAWHLAKQVKQGLVYERCDGQTKEFLEEELEQIKKRDVDKDGKQRLLSKDQIKLIIGRSPDDSDTYIMRSWFDLNGMKNPGMSIVKPYMEPVYGGRTI